MLRKYGRLPVPTMKGYFDAIGDTAPLFDNVEEAKQEIENLEAKII